MTRAQRNHIDLPTLVTVLILMVLSLGVVYSASATWAMEKFGASNRLLNLHAMKVLLGLVALFVGMTIDYKKFKKLTKPAVILSIVFLMVTLALGGEVKGATRPVGGASRHAVPSPRRFAGRRGTSPRDVPTTVRFLGRGSQEITVWTARLRCDHCRHEYLLAFFCKSRGCCPPANRKTSRPSPPAKLPSKKWRNLIQQDRAHRPVDVPAVPAPHARHGGD